MKAPLAELLKQADRLIAKTTSVKQASVEGSSDPFLDLVSAIEEADVIKTDSKTENFEKEAEAFSRVQAVKEIEYLKKLASFEEKARSEGFTNEQIGEALNKVASESLSKNLPLIVSVGLIGKLEQEDKNKLPVSGPKKPRKIIDVTKSLGY